LVKIQANDKPDEVSRSDGFSTVPTSAAASKLLVLIRTSHSWNSGIAEHHLKEEGNS